MILLNTITINGPTLNSKNYSYVNDKKMIEIWDKPDKEKQLAFEKSQ
ncbi:hypothetical protein [Spiroplasma endosymbiont of Dioctria linearis]